MAMRTRPPIRFLLALAVLLPALAGASGARAGTVIVDTLERVVDTSRLTIQFDPGDPEVLDRVVFKDYSPAFSLSTYFGDGTEFWGQTWRGTNGDGYTVYGGYVSRSWAVTHQDPEFVEVTVSSQLGGLPPVVTRYGFHADQPWYTVDRTILFSVVPDTASYQAYVPRLEFSTPYHAVRWRDVHGAIQQRGFCITPCLESGWDGHWTEQMLEVGTDGLSVTSYFPSGTAPGTTLVDGMGPQTDSGWLAPQVPAGAHTTDATWSQLVGFSLVPNAYASMDSLWSVYASGAYLAGVEAGGGRALTIEASPSPFRSGARIDWEQAAAGAYALDVLDVAGRRVARLRAGWTTAGRHSADWNGHDDGGAVVAPGLYFVRFDGPGGRRVARLVRAG